MTVVGARPQFIKAAMVSRALGEFSNCSEEIIHTGQHYDPEMSDIFFSQMNIPEPAVRMELGGGLHGQMTARMLEALEKEMIERKPDLVLVYGDTNSTLAGALAATKLNLPIAHVEAGLRSFNRRMPEEINRVIVDHLSTWLFCPTTAAVNNLRSEGIITGVHHVGDVMFDAALKFGKIAEKSSLILEELRLEHKKYLLATVHRQENTDDPLRLGGIVEGFKRLAAKNVLVWPVHPRLKERLVGLEGNGFCLIKPISFLDMTRLEMCAELILTDSGGVQKEAYFHGTPCITLRDETEWLETVNSGWNQLVGVDPERIEAMAGKASPGSTIGDYGDGHTSEKIAHFLVNY
jgi:UDP-GlcNAc3NAcA epimerase